MSSRLPPDVFLKEFTQRIKMIRESKGWSQQQMARVLEISQGTYHKYECRTLMPHQLLMRFCEETQTDMAYFFYGSASRKPGRVPGSNRQKAG